MNSQNPNGDTVVPNSPTDTVSQLLFSPVNNFLLSASWNKEVAIYDIQNNGAAQLKGKMTHTHPVLCCDWSGDGSQVVSGGSDNQARAWNLATNQELIIGQHAAAIKSIHFVKSLNIVVTGSFDKTVKYWDMRQPQPAANIQLNERVYAMDVKDTVMAVSTATVQESVIDKGQTKLEKKNKIFVYNLSNPHQAFRTIESPLKFQHRSLQIFPDKRGYAVGSVEGRVAISHFQEQDLPLNFAFKCHRIENDIYAVNTIAFHPIGTFATAGSDGVFTYWDKDAKQRLKMFARGPNSITASAFNAAGNIYAYAFGYDWSKGIEYYQRQREPCAIMLHAVQEAEIAKKKPAGK